MLSPCQTDLRISEGTAVPVSRDYYTYAKLTSESMRVSMLSPFRVIIIQYICQTDLRISEGVHAVPVSRDYFVRKMFRLRVVVQVVVVCK